MKWFEIAQRIRSENFSWPLDTEGGDMIQYGAKS